MSGERWTLHKPTRISGEPATASVWAECTGIHLSYWDEVKHIEVVPAAALDNLFQNTTAANEILKGHERDLREKLAEAEKRAKHWQEEAFLSGKAVIAAEARLAEHNIGKGKDEDCTHSCCCCSAQAAEAREKGLLEYARHKDLCHVNNGLPDCSCGFAVLAGEEKPIPPHHSGGYAGGPPCPRCDALAGEEGKGEGDGSDTNTTDDRRP